MGEALGPVIGVVGCAGGVGASALACAVAAMRGGVIVDLDSYGGGLDTALGIESAAGARWSGLQVAGGVIDPVDLSRGLPRWRGAAVLAADGVPPSPAAVRAVVDAGRRLGPVVLDVGRCLCPDVVDTLSDCAVVVLVTVAEPRGLAAARAAARRLERHRVGLVVRRGTVGSAEAAALTGIPVVGCLPAIVRRSGPRIPRSVQRVAGGVLDGVP